MSGPWTAASPWVRQVLACPSCRGVLEEDGGDLTCPACGGQYPQSDSRVIDLMPEGWEGKDTTRWMGRQREMTDAYAELAADREHSLLAWQSDYGPLAGFLSPLEGRVLDVGGGNGIARHWLPGGVEYLSLEPSLDWLEQPWSDLADTFPCLAEPPLTVRGVAEHLPFSDACFDAALSIWSLNHVSLPDRALAETARVLRPGGRLVLVLDDVPPTLGDLLQGRYASEGGRERLALVLRRLLSPVVGWPTQPDHLPLRERALLRGVRSRLEPRQRAWIGAYLVLVLERPA